MDFGRLFGTFWEPKCLQKSIEILDAFLDAKKEVVRIFAGRPGGMCRVPGGNNRGVQGSKNCRRIEEQSQGDPELYLARRPGWGGGPLRAFRRAALYEKSVK